MPGRFAATAAKIMSAPISITGVGRNAAPTPRRRPAGGSKVVLLLPPYSGPPLGPPVGLLSLAAALRQAGYRVRLIDGAVTSHYSAAVEKEIGDALCLGVSLLTGPMIRAAVDV